MCFLQDNLSYFISNTDDIQPAIQSFDFILTFIQKCRANTLAHQVVDVGPFSLVGAITISMLLQLTMGLKPAKSIVGEKELLQM